MYKDTDLDDNSYITDTYQKATQTKYFYTKLGSLQGIPNTEMYDNGTTISIFIVENKQPIFLLNLKRLADGLSTVNVVAHSQHRGKALSMPIYLAVSKHFNKPLYSFGNQSPAGNRIWEKLYQQYPNRIKAVDVTTQEELDVKSVFNDNNFRTRLKLLPADMVEENFKDGKKKGKSRPGRVKRAGASCKGSVTSLRKKAKNSSGEKAKMYHWCANMKSGRKKSK